MNPQLNPTFPLASYPPEPGTASLLGIYDQRQEGLHMQRVKVHRGDISPEQLRALADLARRYTPDYPLHLTTRQDFQFHGVRPEDVCAVQAGIAEVGLTTLGACGDSLRNITTCPENGLVAGTVDVSGIADAIKSAAESLPFIRQIPRKFKMSLSGCPLGCGRPWINDLGFVARAEGTFRVIGAGSLGRRPATGIELYESLDVSEIVPLVVASLRLFNREGDREHRYRARFRHVRERLGDDEFTDRLHEEFQRTVGEKQWPVPQPRTVEKGLSLLGHLHFPFGDIGARLATELAGEVEKLHGRIRLGFEHDLFVYGPGGAELPPDLAALEDGPRIVACPGTTWCSRGLSDSRGVEAALRENSASLDGLSIGISGCPNNCAHAAVADIGLTGRIKKLKDGRTQCFRLLAGGGKGRTPQLGVELCAAVRADTAPQVVAWLAERYGHFRGRQSEASFSEFVCRNRQELAEGIGRVSGVET